MNDTELRDQFDQWAAPLRAISAPEFPGIRRRARRRNARLAAAIGSAAAVLAVAGVTAGLLSGSGTATIGRPAWPAGWGSGRYPAPPGQPYVLTIAANGHLVLRDAATGSSIRDFAPGSGQFVAVTAASGDRLFVVARQSADGHVSFAELRLSGGDGGAGLNVTGLTPVLAQSAVPNGAEITAMSVSRSGSRLALAYSETSASGSQGGLQVYDVPTGQLMGSWHAGEAGLSSPEFLAGGDTLAVNWAVSATGASGGRAVSLQLRFVTTTAAFLPGSSLLRDSRRDPHRAASGSLSADGSVTLNTLNGQVGVTTTESGQVPQLIERSAATGRVIARTDLGPVSDAVSSLAPASAADAEGSFCGVLWASANAHQLLTQCGTEQLAITGGKATRVRLAWLFPVSLRQPSLPWAW